MSEQIKFTEDEMANISSIQSEYQAIGTKYVQLKLAQTNANDYVKKLQEEETTLNTMLLEINQKEQTLAAELERKYGKGELNAETGVFTPAN